MLEFKWVDRLDRLDEFADFFVRNTDSSYISHGEMMCDRALSSDRWAPDLRAVLVSEWASSPTTQIATCEENGDLVGLAVVAKSENARQPYWILEDLIIETERRGQKTGTGMIEWIESEAIKAKVQRLFLESGISNERAHGFFQENKFQIVSKVFMKDL
jgi:GNAT superfamily N-acetyltransferase